MNVERASTIRRQDYTPPPYLVDHVDLDVEFLSGEVQIQSTLTVRRAPAAAPGTPFRLDGQQLETLMLAIDGQPLAAEAHCLDAQSLTLFDPPADFVLSTRVRIRPDENTSLSGLYASQDGYCTQCEAQGFRRITWFPDRPDIMARYTVTLHADRERLPVLLANGNPAGHGDEASGRHWARWQDPFAKPCYLFAMVAAAWTCCASAHAPATGVRSSWRCLSRPACSISARRRWTRSNAPCAGTRRSSAWPATSRTT